MLPAGGTDAPDGVTENPVEDEVTEVTVNTVPPPLVTVTESVFDESVGTSPKSMEAGDTLNSAATPVPFTVMESCDVGALCVK